MEGVLYLDSAALGSAVVRAEKLGCEVIAAKKPSPEAQCELRVRLSQAAANAVALAVWRNELTFSVPPDDLPH